VTRNLDGRVELTWTNKAQRLISHEDPAIKPPYAWVRSSDFRVAETRLLEEVVRVGEAAAESLLIRGGDGSRRDHRVGGLGRRRRLRCR
jgi:hypothetical protein